jgi:hypothetical protein
VRAFTSSHLEFPASLFVDDIIIPVFPGGYLPTFTLLTDTLRSGSKNRLIVDSVLIMHKHYANGANTSSTGLTRLSLRYKTNIVLLWDLHAASKEEAKSKFSRGSGYVRPGSRVQLEIIWCDTVLSRRLLLLL